MEAILSSETSVYNKPTPRHIPENGILYINILANAIDFNTFFERALYFSKQTIMPRPKRVGEV
jgi:hypothetical protein